MSVRDRTGVEAVQNVGAKSRILYYTSLLHYPDDTGGSRRPPKRATTFLFCIKKQILGQIGQLLGTCKWKQPGKLS